MWPICHDLHHSYCNLSLCIHLPNQDWIIGLSFKGLLDMSFSLSPSPNFSLCCTLLTLSLNCSTKYIHLTTGVFLGDPSFGLQQTLASTTSPFFPPQANRHYNNLLSTFLSVIILTHTRLFPKLVSSSHIL